MTSSTLDQLVVSSNSTTSDNVTIDASDAAHKEPVDRNIESAVFAHIQALRALGHTTVNTAQIAAALSLPLSTVERTLESLQKKGVKKLNV